MAAPKAVTRYGPRKIGEEAFDEQQKVKKMTAPDGTVYGKRKGGGDEAGPLATLKDELFELTVDKVFDRIQEIDDPKALTAVHALETSNPSHDGGRKGVLNAIEERRGELEIEEDGGTPETPETVDDDAPADVTQLEAILEEHPDQLDELIEEELAEGDPRPEAVALFLEAELSKGEDARADVLELLDDLTEDEEE